MKKKKSWKKAGKGALLALTITGMVYSCKKIEEKNTSSSPQNVTGIAKSGGDDFYKNASNPYDYVGQQHNEGLDYIRTNILSWHSDPGSVDDSIRTLTVRYASQTLGASPDELNESLNAVYAYNDVEVDSTEFLHLIETWDISDNAKSHMASLMRSVLNYSDDPINLRVDAIKKVEDKILADKKLTTDEQISLLGGASVARYSAYWLSQHPDPWPSSVSPEGFPWFPGAVSAFLDFVGYEVMRRTYDYPVVDSIAGALLVSALGFAYLAYNF